MNRTVIATLPALTLMPCALTLLVLLPLAMAPAFGTGAGVAAGAGEGAGAGAAAGKAVFRRQCILCHSAEAGDDGGAQGPSLAGIYGRRAAGGARFSYTQALLDSKLTWDGPTLQRFLASPSSVVPGTAMLVAVPSQTDRDDLIAYFQSLGNAATASPTTSASPAPSANAASSTNPESPIPSASKRSADWREDAPGRVHRIDVDRLPAPFATPSTRNGPQLVERPAGAELKLPRGFHIDTFADNLLGPRKMLEAANGDIFVTETRGGRVSILHPSTDGARAAHTDVYLRDLKQPFGIAFYPDAKSPAYLYIAETHRITRYAYQVGDVNPHGEAEIVVPALPSRGGHSTRDLAFSDDGATMFVSVGSGSNVAESLSKKTPAQAKAWDAQHGLGAAWDDETDRAAVLTFDARNPGAPRVYAAGIRNCVSLTVQPANGALWCTTNERDLLGDDLVPDYSTRVEKGSFYGWPWYYFGSHEDPRLKGDRPDLKGRVSMPDVPYQAHSAALNLTFYTATDGASAFPTAFDGDAFAAFHGSWNRSLRTGYKLVRVRMQNDLPTGEYQDFLTGFIVDDGKVWGRPVATVELKDGSLLLSDDGANAIYRISYAR